AKDFQIKRFRAYLRLYMLDVLNGKQDDPIVAKSGKLGYLYSFVDEVVNINDYFLKFLTKVREARESMGLMADKQARSNRSHSAMNANASRKLFFVFTHPSAHSSQEQYLAAVQAEIETVKDELLFTTMRETAEGMRDIARQARDEIRKWIYL